MINNTPVTGARDATGFRHWRRALCGAMIALGGVAACANTSRLSMEEVPPNILFIFADDHAYQALGAYGSVLNETPNIDRIAAAGMRFDRALVTNSICAPSRAVVLSGLYSHINGVLDNVDTFDGLQTTFPKLLRGAGYETAAFGKWHLKSAPTGFDRWEVLPGQGNYYNPDLRTPEGVVRHEGYVTEVITDLAVDWLADERDPDRPFFMWLGHKAPHRNWMPGPAELGVYADTVFPEPPTLFDDYSGRASPASNQEMEIDRHMTLVTDLKVGRADSAPDGELEYWARLMDRLTTEQRAAWDAEYAPRNEAFAEAGLEGRDLVRWKYQEYLRDYLRTIAAIDTSVGRVLDSLETLGIADNTVVVYASDQGFYLGEHGWFDKRWIYEESLRTPLLVRWPGETDPGAASQLIVSNLDLAPTFLDLAGLEAPTAMQGRSLVPVLRGEDPEDWRRSFYYHYYEGANAVHAVAEHYGVVTERHKLVRFPETDEWEMFDLSTDPHELASIHADAAHQDLRAELAEELVRLRHDLGVVDDPDPGSEDGA